MKIERFKYHEKFCVKSTFLDTSIDVEGTLDPGETLPEAVAKAREEIIKSLPGTSTIPEMRYAGHVLYPESIPTHSLPTISKDFEKLEIAIDNAQTVEELKQIKSANRVMPARLNDAWNKKMDELLDKAAEFTDGLE